MTFGERLTQARHMRDLTQAQLATKCGVPKNCIYYYENDMVIPNIYAIYLIAEALQVSIDGLVNLGMGGIEFPKIPKDRYRKKW